MSSEKVFISWKAQPFESSCLEFQLLKFHPLRPTISHSQHCIICHTKMHKSQKMWHGMADSWYGILLARTSLQKVVRLVIKHNSLFVCQCWLLPITFLSFMSLAMNSRISWREADWPVVPHTFIFNLHEGRSGTCFLPVLRNCSQLSWRQVYQRWWRHWTGKSPGPDSSPPLYWYFLIQIKPRKGDAEILHSFVLRHSGFSGPLCCLLWKAESSVQHATPSSAGPHFAAH